MAIRLFWTVFALFALLGTLRADEPAPPPTDLAPESLPPLPARFARPQPVSTHIDPPAENAHTETRSWPRAAPQLPARSVPIGYGLALTLSAITVGMWLTRWRSRRMLSGGVLLVAVVLLGVSGCPWSEEARETVRQQTVRILGQRTDETP